MHQILKTDTKIREIGEWYGRRSILLKEKVNAYLSI